MKYLLRAMILLKLIFGVFVTFADGLFLAEEKNACSDIVSYHFADLSPNCWHNPDVLSNIRDIIQRQGYNPAIYSITTQDGYVLELIHLKPNSSGIPVIVLHGITTNVESWVCVGNRSIAYHLDGNGYDVWLGTVRGGHNSNMHKSLSINDPEYWEFCLDTIIYDWDAQLEFIYNATGKKVIIVGHSMATTISLMYASELPEKTEQTVEGIIALAPVVYLDGLPLIESVKSWAYGLLNILEASNIKGLFYQETSIHVTATRLCKILPEFCFWAITSISGETEQISPADLLIFFSYWPGGTSIYQLKQYLQIANSKKFQKYDFGPSENLKKYNSSEPPLYDLSKVQVPVFMFYGKHDIFYRAENIERAYNELGTSTKSAYPTPINGTERSQYAHVDFLYSVNLDSNFYDNFFSIIDPYFLKN